MCNCAAAMTNAVMIVMNIKLIDHSLAVSTVSPFGKITLLFAPKKRTLIFEPSKLALEILPCDPQSVQNIFLVKNKRN